MMVPGGRLFSLSFITRVIIARCVINNPKIVIINDILQNLERSERIRIIRHLTSQEVPWSLIIVSNDPLVMKTCRKVLVLDQGEVVVHGKYDEISTNEKFRELLDYKTTFAF
jgi:ABC-type antimicrobial peptide transport system ATPase subunit